jgi:hypothetical protein
MDIGLITQYATVGLVLIILHGLLSADTFRRNLLCLVPSDDLGASGTRSDIPLLLGV